MLYSNIMIIDKCSRIAQKQNKSISRKMGGDDLFSAGASPSLDALISGAMTYPKDSENRLRMLRIVLSNHGGISAGIAARFSSYLEYSDAIGFFWEALQILPDVWEPSKGKASTCLAKIMKNLIGNHIYWTHMVGSVRVPLRSKRFKKADISTESVLYEVEMALENKSNQYYC